MSNKKIIGWTGPSVFNAEVQSMIEECFGAIPLYLNQNVEEDLIFLANQCDGFVLAGGVDIFPTSYGREVTNGDGLKKFDVARDKRENELITFAFANKKPIAGICRGHQMLGVRHGMYLIPNIGGSDVCHSPREIEVGGEPIHFVRVTKNYREELGFTKTLVNSFHHQAIICSPAPNYEKETFNIDVLAHANLNYNNDKSKVTKIIELMRDAEHKWISCQWHPEADWQYNEASEWFVNEFKKMLKIK